MKTPPPLFYNFLFYWEKCKQAAKKNGKAIQVEKKEVTPAGGLTFMLRKVLIYILLC